MRPLSAGGEESWNWIWEVDVEPSIVFEREMLRSGLSMPSLATSAARLEYLGVDRSASAELWFRMYLNSEGGKDGAKGTAMALLARTERRVTVAYLQHGTPQNARHGSYIPT